MLSIFDYTENYLFSSILANIWVLNFGAYYWHKWIFLIEY
jgi:hypothetical protein